MKSLTWILFSALVAAPVALVAKSDVENSLSAVADKVIAEQRKALASAAQGHPEISTPGKGLTLWYSRPRQRPPE